MESLDEQLKLYKQQKKRTVVYLENNLIRRLSSETKSRVLKKVSDLDVRIFNEDNADDILRYKNLVVLRYGVMPHRVESRLPLKNTVVISGEF